MLLVILTVLVITISYYLLQRHYQYWIHKGVPGPKPILFFGNFARGLFLKASPGQIYAEIYNKFPCEEMVGIYRLTTPVLLIRDPNLIKEITTKSFSHFQDNDIHVDKKMDPLFGRSPFVLKGEEWKIVRAQLTPAFTSGKMKWLFPLLEEVSKDLVKFIENQPEATNGEGYEAKELCARFTLNNVATCAFGLEGKCFEESESHFRQLARDFFSPDGWSAFCFFLVTLFPPLIKIISIKLTAPHVEKQLIDMITKTLKYRKENSVVRNDFLHVMSQLKTSCKDYEFEDLDVTAHAAGFFGDGFETSATVMSFILFEIATNPEVQKKLRQEINKAFTENEQKLPYDALQSLHYLDAVINETLRLHPSVFMLQKLCTKSFTYTLKSTGKSVTIEEKTPIVLPLYGLHHDPNYYPEPEIFKPERFLESNRDNLTKYTFLPFGEGPRACLGQRFGLLQVKIGIGYIIRNYELFVNRKTQLPIKYQVTNVVTTPLGGLWLDFKKLK